MPHYGESETFAAKSTRAQSWPLSLFTCVSATSFGTFPNLLVYSFQFLHNTRQGGRDTDVIVVVVVVVVPFVSMARRHTPMVIAVARG
jgi:hypothetical protein